ncbi:MAG: PLP-dependent aminotransferase family protein [Ruminococcaceae bacterium]|nr:PLP-dependent aminotransferase family protein [Oscillospiraceae bacterium]
MKYNFSDKLSNLKPSAIREIFKSLSDPTVISFAAGNPAPESFPVEAIEKISADIFRTEPVTALQYGITEGYPPLRNAIAERQKKRFGEGMVRDGESVMVVSGGQQGIELACKAFCNEGDAVICEDPSFIGALNSFRSNGARTVGVPMESDGIDINALEETLKTEKRAKLLYIIPTFQNPTGITMSVEKRRAVLSLAEKYNIMILEDNPYGELRFAGKDIPTLKSMDDSGRVIYCSSFSKILSAGMRVGFVIAPDVILSKMTVAKQSEDVHTNVFFQMLSYRFMSEFDIDGHIAKINDLYRKKCTLMLDCIDKYIDSEYAEFTRAEGGLFIWGTLKGMTDSTPLVKKALEKKVAVVPGSAFNCDPSLPSPSFRLNYSTPSDEQIVTGIKALGETIREMYS